MAQNTDITYAQRAVRLVRHHSMQWGINPRRIGVAGFSAGAHLVAAASTNFATTLYPPKDATDLESSRPDFGIAIYPGHLAQANIRYDVSQSRIHVSQAAQQINVPKHTPAQFIVQAEDDTVDGVGNALAYYKALAGAGIPVEMHLYARGGHAFGLRRTDLPVDDWPSLMYTWLESIGILQPSS